MLEPGGDGDRGAVLEVGGDHLDAAFGLSLHLLEAYFHAWDLAASLGRGFAPDDELTDTVTAAAQAVISDGMRGDAVDLDAGSPVGRLVTFAGRDPRRRVTVAS